MQEIRFLNQIINSNYVLVQKNLTIHKESRKFLKDLHLNFENIYEEIGFMIGNSRSHRSELMFNKKIIQRDEIHN